MKINAEDAKLLFDVDQISARLDVLFVNYLPAALEAPQLDFGIVEANMDSLKKHTTIAVAGVQALNMSLASLKAAVAQFVAQNNRTLLGIIEKELDSGNKSDEH